MLLEEINEARALVGEPLDGSEQCAVVHGPQAAAPLGSVQLLEANVQAGVALDRLPALGRLLLLFSRMTSWRTVSEVWFALRSAAVA